VQPLVASILAIIDGVKDAKTWKPAYFWAVIVTPGQRKELIKDGWKSVGKVFILAMVLEVTYQVITHHLAFRGYLFVAAFALAICPYLLLRGPTSRIVRLFRKQQKTAPSTAIATEGKTNELQG
jgi:hypothetical protein